MRMACCQSENEMITMCSFFSRKRPLNGRLFIDVLYVPYLPFTVNISIASFPMIFIYVVIRSVSAKFTVVWPGHLHAIKFQIYTLRTRCRYLEATKKIATYNPYSSYSISFPDRMSQCLSLFSLFSCWCCLAATTCHFSQNGIFPVANTECIAHENCRIKFKFNQQEMS